jgi:AcrR family transcriptional regulator
LTISSRTQIPSSGWWEGLRAALVVAHPGHELRVYHWLEQARPLVLVLTDGSGHTSSSRVATTTAVLQRAKASPSTFYGRLSDRELYQAILGRRVTLFESLVEQIAQVLTNAGVEYVAGDAVEGINPGHDVCRLLVNAAISRMREASGRQVANLEFPLEGPPLACPAADLPEAIILNLDEDAYQRKLEAIRSYPEVAVDVERLLAAHGAGAFRVECLSPVRYSLDISGRFKHPAVYEWYGEKQVQAGHYQQVIRFREHLAPLAECLAAKS